MAIKALGLTTLAILCTLSSPPVRAQAKPDGEALLRRADEIRNPSESFKMRVRLTGDDGDSALEVFVKGKDKSVLVTKSPARDVGRNMLMLERDFYLYMPNLKRALRLSLSQKLSGQVANGDIARTRWSGDYSVRVESSDAKETTLVLDGKAPGLTYQKIRLVVETKRARPVRAEYLSLDGKVVLKRASFGAYKTLAGAERPSLMRIEDAGGKWSEIHVESMERAKLDDSFFAQGKLESLR